MLGMSFIVNMQTPNRQERYLLENNKAGMLWQLLWHPCLL